MKLYAVMRAVCFVLGISAIMACHTSSAKRPDSPGTNTDALPEGSFGYDLAFLKKHDSVIVLKNGDAQVIVSPRYQGKVFTSTAHDLAGKSFGWINYKAFDAPADQHMNAYGGENRFWLGPEGGAYSVFFPKDAAMEFKNWKTPPAVDYEPWSVISQNDTSVTLQKYMQVTNYKGVTYSILIDRKVALLDKKNMESLLGIHTGSDLEWVGYRTGNTITNKGDAAWNEATGVPCIWMLDMFPPSDSTVIAIPYTAGSLPPANTEYFGKIPPDRIVYKNNVLFFKADGKQRGKLGIKPERALPVAGSYDAAHQVLTIALFEVASHGRYLNQEWRTDKPVFSGDAENAYNDGPLDGGGQLGPFYEIESVSPPCFLKPGEKASHDHTVLHFTGNEKSLDEIARKVLKVSLEDLKNIFSHP